MTCGKSATPKGGSTWLSLLSPWATAAPVNTLSAPISGFCLQGGVLSPGELLVHAAAPPRGLLSVGLVIDDLVCLDQVLTSDLAAIHAGKVRSEGGRRLKLLSLLTRPLLLRFRPIRFSEIR